MRYFLAGLRYLLATLIGLALLLTLVSAAPSTVWWVQVLGFPRLQTLGVLAAAGAGLPALGGPAHRWAWLLLPLGCSLGLVIQGSFLRPCLPVASKAVPTASAIQARDSASHLHILVINVLIN